jgi:tripartite-type tricarboxylate transporter receptor subunit TctC
MKTNSYNIHPMAQFMRASAVTCIALCSLLGVSVDAMAQRDFPTRPVRMVNPYTPGGSVDLVARALAAGLSELWGQQVIVDNRPGAGTQIGTEVVVRAEPDGYTMLCTSSAIAILPATYRSMRFDPARDLLPVVLATHSASMLVVHPGLSAKSVKELIALARSQPGQLTAASSGVGSTVHLILEMFKASTKTDILHVPYKGGAPAITDLIGGQVKLFFNTPGTLLQHVKSGRLRALGVTSAQRVDYAPDLPTLAEAGVPDFEANIWYAMYGPKALPPALAQRWNDVTNRYLKSPQAQEYFRQSYMAPVGGTSAEFVKYHLSEIKRWSAAVVAAGIKPQ